MTAEHIYLSHSPSQTHELASLLAPKLQPGICVLLYGDLGAGKTEFVRGLGSALGISGVRSPSFTLINEYEADCGLRVIHADLYRLEDADSLGLEEYEDSVLLVEWPERWSNPPVNEVIELHFTPISETERAITLIAHGTLAESVIAEL